MYLNLKVISFEFDPRIDSPFDKYEPFLFNLNILEKLNNNNQANNLEDDEESDRIPNIIFKVAQTHKKSLKNYILPQSMPRLIQSLKSPYSASQYRIKIQLSTKYPEEPPIIKFIDPIDHINICSKTGQVSMPILKQDWSPYISPYILIDVIDSLLVQPQLSQQYMVGSQKYNKNTFSSTSMVSLQIANMKENQKLFEHISRIQNNYSGLENINAFQSVIIQPVRPQKYSFAQVEDQLKPITSMKKRIKRLKTIVLEKADNQADMHKFQAITSPQSPVFPLSPTSPQSPQNSEISNFSTMTKSPSKFIQEPNSPKSPKTPFFSLSGVKINKKQTIKSQILQNICEIQQQHINSQISLTNSKKSQPKSGANLMNSTKIIKQLSSKKISPIKEQSNNHLKDSTPSLIKKTQQKSTNLIANMPTLLKNSSQKLVDQVKLLKSTINLESSTQTINKLNKLLDFITKEYLQLEKKRQNIKNPYLMKILHSKINEHLEMIEELEGLSMKVKRNMIKKLKNQINC